MANNYNICQLEWNKIVTFYLAKIEKKNQLINNNTKLNKGKKS